jgi:hypothetical protein
MALGKPIREIAIFRKADADQGQLRVNLGRCTFQARADATVREFYWLMVSSHRRGRLARKKCKLAVWSRCLRQAAGRYQ